MLAVVIGAQADAEGGAGWIGHAPGHGGRKENLLFSDRHGYAHGGLGLEIASQGHGESAIAHVGEDRVAQRPSSIVELDRQAKCDAGESSGVFLQG